MSSDKAFAGIKPTHVTHFDTLTTRLRGDIKFSFVMRLLSVFNKENQTCRRLVSLCSTSLDFPSVV